MLKPKSKIQNPNELKKSKIKKKLIWFCLFVSLVICHLSFVIYSTALAVEYDGIWFMGFNLKSPVFKNPEARQAVNQTINKAYIATVLMSQEAVPVSIIPPTMIGYDPDLKPVTYDLKQAKALMQKAGFPINSKQLKSISLLHTDGLKTVAAAQTIQKNLENLGIKVNLVPIKYQDNDKWVDSLSSGKYDLFLMGYKAGIEELFSTEEAGTSKVDSYNLVEPLFATTGDANFTNYSNAKVNQLLKQIAGINLALKSDRNTKLKQINQTLFKDLPVIVLFYIEKI